MIPLLLLYNILNLYDYISTKILLTHVEITEANPIARWLLSHNLFLASKVLLSVVMSVVGVLIMAIPFTWLIVLVGCIPLLIVDVNNTRNYIALKGSAKN